jgi:hypothetical protein
MTKYPQTPKLAEWLEATTKQMASLLAELSGTSVAMFRQWIPGRRGISADMAGRLVDGMRKLREDHRAAPDPLTRGDLCDACRKCEYFKNRGE